jgi:osmotically inducible lipoprotein OsmB
MSKRSIYQMSLIALLSIGLVGCEYLPRDRGARGAVIGGAGGAAAGAVIGGREHRLLGALLGGALGAAGGYVIGANTGRIRGQDQEAAREAAVQAQQNPVTAEQALRATTADINNDGFVTLDEVVAMHQAGLTDQQMLQRMRATDQVFELSQEQRQYLMDRGISRAVINEMENINSELREELLRTQPVIGTTPAGTPRY